MNFNSSYTSFQNFCKISGSVNLRKYRGVIYDSVGMQGKGLSQNEEIIVARQPQFQRKRWTSKSRGCIVKKGAENQAALQQRKKW